MANLDYYFDEMMPRKVAEQLVGRGYVVIMAVDVGMVGKDDLQDHLTYAAQHELVLVTFDRPFSARAMAQSDHHGLICWAGLQNDFGGQVIQLAEFADQHTKEQVMGQVFWIKRL